MDWTDWWTWLEPVGFLGGLIWLLKVSLTQLLQKDMQKDVERAKAELKASYDTQLERLKAELRLGELRYAKLHERRIEVIVTLYQHLVCMEDRLTALINPVQQVRGDPEETRARAAADAFNAFTTLYGNNRIFFSQASCDVLDGLSREAHTAWLVFTYKELYPRPVEKWAEAWKNVSEQMPSSRAVVEADMRKLLGVADHG